MFLTKHAILEAVEKKQIAIDPFEPKHLSPNSIDVTLNKNLLVYDIGEEGCLDMKKQTPTREIVIPESGYVLQPNMLYIGSTNETATSNTFIPMFEGRSSIGRLGINTHITAGFGDIGWGYEEQTDGTLKCLLPTWTLEICVVHPVRVYPDVRIGQVYFVKPEGKVEFYKGKYSAQRTPQPSKSYLDFQ